MPEGVSQVILGIALALMVAFWVVFFISIPVQKLLYKYGKVKTVQAVVISTYRTETVSYKGTGTRVNCGVVFRLENGKKLSFRVSEFSYSGYRKGETGTLKYKGDRLIEFR